MSSVPDTEASQRSRFDSLALAAGVAALADTSLGAVVSLGLDLRRTNELVFAISFLLALPMYLLDV